MFEKCSFFSTIQGLKIPKFTVCLTDDRSTNARQYSIPHTKNLKVLRQWILKFSSHGELKKWTLFKHIFPLSFAHIVIDLVKWFFVALLLPWTDFICFSSNWNCSNMFVAIFFFQVCYISKHSITFTNRRAKFPKVSNSV